MDKSLVSVIVPTYNSWETIWMCLKSIKEQTYTNIEIIVVDNNSIDDTKEISKKYTDKVYNKWPERTFQKNFWIEKSKWKFVLFIDSDMQVWKNVVEECIKRYDNNTWWICIPEHSVWKWYFVKIRDFERSFYEWTWIESARFFLKEDVNIVWWFENDLIFFEESLLPQKIESQLWKKCSKRINVYINHHEWNINIVKRLKKKFYYGKSLQKYKKKVKEIWIKNIWNSQMWLLQRYTIFLKNKRFYRNPCLAIWVLFLKTCEFFAWFLWILFGKK